MIREIIELGDPVLREKAVSVTDFTSEELISFIQDLQETMEISGGVGIAAPQVGVSQRIFIVASKPNSRYPNAPLMEPTAMINPTLEWASSDMEKDWEGCLSIPGIRGLVPRPKEIKISYIEPGTAAKITAEYSGFIARIWQHEYDHLEGLVFLDRADPQDIVTNKEYLRFLEEIKTK